MSRLLQLKSAVDADVEMFCFTTKSVKFYLNNKCI